MADDIETLKLRAKAKLKLQGQGQGQPQVSAEEEVVETGPIEAGIRSASQAVAFNFADEIEAGIDTAVDFVKDTDQSLEDVSNNYNENLEHSRKEFAENKREHPTADMVGTGVGVAASLALPASAIARSAQGLTGAAKIGALYGGFAAVGSAEDKLSLEGAIQTAEGAALGAVAGPVMNVAARGIGVVGQKVMEPGKELINKAFKGIGLGTPAQRTKFAKELQKKGKEPVEWLKRISGMKDVNGKPLINDITEGMSTIHSKVGNKVTKLAEQRDEILAQVNVKIDRSDLAKQVKMRLTSSEKLNAQDVTFVDSLIDDALVYKAGTHSKTGQIIKVPNEEPMSAIGISTLRKSLDEGIKFDSVTNSNSLKKSLRNTLNDITDDLISKNVDDASAATGKQLRSEMSDLFDLQGALEKGIVREQFGDNAAMIDVIQATKAKMLVRGIVPKQIENFIGTAAIALRQMSISPRINRSKAFNSLRLAEALPKVSEETMRRFMTTVDTDDVLAFNEASAAIVGEADLMDAPLSRSSEEALMRKDSILAVAQMANPDLATALRQAFKANDTVAIGATLSELSKLPQASKLFQEGVGFDNKVFSEEDKRVLEKQLRNTDMPTIERMKLLKDMHENGNIPDASSVEPRQPNKYIPREKDDFNY